MLVSNPSAFQPYTKVKTCRYGSMLYNIHDRFVGKSLDLYGEFSEGEIEVFRSLIQPGEVVLDIGANIGCHTVFMAQQVGSHGMVYAFEPQRLVYQMLCANLALNSIPNVEAKNVALGREPGEILVPVLNLLRENNVGGLELGGFSQGIATPVLTLDSLNLQRCDLIKLDVEGMEEEVLRGATQTLTTYKPILYVENDRDEKAASLIRYIDSLGYDLYWHMPPLYHAANFAGNPQNVFGNIVSVNMLCTHRSMPVGIKGLARIEIPSA